MFLSPPVTDEVTVCVCFVPVGAVRCYKKMTTRLPLAMQPPATRPLATRPPAQTAAPTATKVASSVYLWTSSQRALAQDGAPALSRLLLHAAKERERQPLPDRAAQHCCAACFTLLLPGVNASKVSVQSHPHRAASRRCSLAIRCSQCGHKNNLPTGVRPAARSCQALAATAPPPTAKKKAQKRGAAPPQPQQRPQAQAKRPRAGGGASRAVPPKAAAATGSDTLFGFDFVPL